MLLQYDPFRELDRVADQAFARATPTMPMDAVRRGDTVHVFLDLPGVDPGSIDLEVERNVLTVKAERRWAREADDQVLANERRQGSFLRRLLLGDTLDGDRVAADYRDGVLAITIPVAEAAKPRKVSVGTGDSSSTAIEAESNDAAAA
ncbi:MAG TPA: Hsp20/alpha crystallin family protein [Acidimicrobiales bacterium]|nr:Hsp20/alpha crystallin family protein [Acidimicrobiales bacterium]